MHVCMHVPTAAQPHLKGVRGHTTCVSVCVATISLLHPLCLSVCLLHVRPCVLMLVYAMLRCYACVMCNKHLMLGQTPVIYTHTYTHSHTFNTFTQAQYFVNTETHTLTEAMKARQKRRLSGPTNGCCPTKDSCIEKKQRVRRQAAVRLRCTQKSKTNKSHSSPPQLKGAQVISACVRARVL
jgi:hypothetical protein